MSTKVVNFCTACGYPFQSGDKVCGNCGRQRYEDENIDATIYCPDCGREILPDNGVLYCFHCQRIIEPTDNNQERKPGSSFQKAMGQQSTTLTQRQVPEEVRQWSWPAFWLMAPWLFAHGMAGWAVLMLVNVVLSFIPFIGLIFAVGNIVMFFIFCIKGNELAWKRGQFRNLVHFIAREGKWMQAVWRVLIISIVVGIILGFMSYMYYGGRAKMESLGPLPTVVHRNH